MSSRIRACAYIPFHGSLVTDLIKVIRGYARLKLRGSDVQYFAGQLTNLAHRLLGSGVEKIDFGPI